MFRKYLIALMLCSTLRGASTACADDADEIARLRKELSEARSEIDRLNKENAALKAVSTEKLTGTNQSVAARAAASPARPAGGELPAIKPGEVVEAQALLNHYRTGPIGADRRYKDQRFKIRGIVERIDPPFAGLTYTLFLRGPDKFGLIRCATKSPGITAVSMTPDRRTILGEPAFKPKRPLATIGDTITLEGICTGYRDSMIHFDKCRPN